MIKNVHRSTCRVPLFLSEFNETNCLDRFLKNPHISKLMKIHPVEAEFVRAEEQTDWQTNMMKLTDGLTDKYDEANRRTDRQIWWS